MGEEFVGCRLGLPDAGRPHWEDRPGRGTEEIEESIRLILVTAPGERPMRPEFGCAIHDYVFAPADASTAGDIALRGARRARQVGAAHRRRRRRRPLRRGRPGLLYIDIEYAVRGTNDPRNLVFPFYVIPPHEEVGA